MLCENCGIEHDSGFASGRFCSRGCSNSFSTKAKRTEINKKYPPPFRVVFLVGVELS